MIAKATRESVEDAIRQLTDEGKKINPTTIHHITGGSRSTIYQILSEIDQDKMRTAMKVGSEYSDELVNETATAAIKALYDSCWKKAEQIAKVAYKRDDDREKEALSVMERLDAIEETYTARVETLKAIIAQKDAEIGQLVIENHMFRERLEKLGGQAAATSPLDKKEHSNGEA